jgi:poly-gamma-glutamate synthesis protein (capsule biosynthesis protein)
VIVSVHWGDERLPMPSPEQISQAHKFVTAGASLVLGHHPHRLQGMELYYGAAVAYSLGNFVASEVPFSDGDRVTWNRVERTGAILRATLAGREVRDVAMVPSYDDGRTIRLDPSGHGDRLIARANRAVSRGVTPGSYAWECFVVKRLRPALRKLSWSGLAGMRRKLTGAAPAPEQAT